MKTLKKWIALLASAVAAFTLLAACGEENGTGGNSPDDEKFQTLISAARENAETLEIYTLATETRMIMDLQQGSESSEANVFTSLSLSYDAENEAYGVEYAAGMGETVMGRETLVYRDGTLYLDSEGEADTARPADADAVRLLFDTRLALGEIRQNIQLNQGMPDFTKQLMDLSMIEGVSLEVKDGVTTFFKEMTPEELARLTQSAAPEMQAYLSGLKASVSGKIEDGLLTECTARETIDSNLMGMRYYCDITSTQTLSREATVTIPDTEFAPGEGTVDGVYALNRLYARCYEWEDSVLSDNSLFIRYPAYNLIEVWTEAAGETYVSAVRYTTGIDTGVYFVRGFEYRESGFDLLDMRRTNIVIASGIREVSTVYVSDGTEKYSLGEEETTGFGEKKEALLARGKKPFLTDAAARCDRAEVARGAEGYSLRMNGEGLDGEVKVTFDGRIVSAEGTMDGKTCKDTVTYSYLSAEELFAGFTASDYPLRRE